MLCLALKDGRIFLDAFLRHSKALHILFSTQLNTVIALLSALQKATRQLQSICSYGKQKRDKSLAHEAPYLKRALESLIYKMKEMASDNKCLGAVYVGSLKNRRLDGTEIYSDDDVSGEENESENFEESESERDSLDDLSSESDQKEEVPDDCAGETRNIAENHMTTDFESMNSENDVYNEKEDNEKPSSWNSLSVLEEADKKKHFLSDVDRQQQARKRRRTHLVASSDDD